MSFVLQFTASADSAQKPAWRAALQEVESGHRETVTSLEGLVAHLVGHGVHLPHEKPPSDMCARCRAALGESGRGA